MYLDEFGDHSKASSRLVILSALRNSCVCTVYAIGVSERSLAVRPPETDEAATKPSSLSVLTVNGESTTASSLASELGRSAGAVWADAIVVASTANTAMSRTVGLVFTVLRYVCAAGRRGFIGGRFGGESELSTPPSIAIPRQSATGRPASSPNQTLSKPRSKPRATASARSEA
jgi:hypothetical protein